MSPLQNNRMASPEESEIPTPSSHPTDQPRFKASAAKRNAPRQTIPLLDANGFRVKRQQIDAKETTPAEQAGKSSIDGVNQETSIADEVSQGAKYVIDGPLRRVPPYYFTYLTFCKQRWRDRNLLDLFTSEFRDRDAAYYVRYQLHNASLKTNMFRNKQSKVAKSL